MRPVVYKSLGTSDKTNNILPTVEDMFKIVKIKIPPTQGELVYPAPILQREKRNLLFLLLIVIMKILKLYD